MHEKTDMFCPLCYSNYGTGFPQRIPRELDCRHTFCTECLLKLQELQGSVIECSSCKLRTLLPANGVDGLGKNMDLLRAVLQSEEEEQKLCNFCIQKVYPPKPATFYCSDCEVFMCGSCSDNIHSQLEFRCHDINRATGVKDGVRDDTSTSRPSSSLSTLSQRSLGLRPGLNNRPSSSLLNYSAIPECPTHKEKTKYYCRNCRCLCCASCHRYGSHKNHSCFQVHEAEEKERKALVKLQTQVEQRGAKIIKARGEVQQTIEGVKKNTIEISSLTTTACRNCDNALSLDYYEMLMLKKDVETEIMSVLEMLCEINPVAEADLGCQFPNHEKLLSNIRSCAKLVLPPGPPEKLTCKITDNYNVHVKWDPPEDNLFLYPVLCYILQSSSGKESSLTIDKIAANLAVGKQVQFRACALNLIGQGPWGFPYGIKIPE
ncbi:hypothetical protein pdam_00008971 [Pocillopora damicornis]|uniref:RING-type E3 ubiquitin transferase n=1 Tax=Pocillopora damicornis TaxID=46731 RepID=A0A3M6T5W5_POCDA|nr:hypothetical protein pdam_00008971 [Pocillopora damicornis]